jgi:glycogen operon protein
VISHDTAGDTGDTPQLEAGAPQPLGAEITARGINFAVYSSQAERVELCLFDGGDEETRIPLVEREAFNWHCYIPGIGPGQRYGYRVYGDYAPASGKRFNPYKLLIDPYAKAIEGPVEFTPAVTSVTGVPEPTASGGTTRNRIVKSRSTQRTP